MHTAIKVGIGLAVLGGAGFGGWKLWEHLQGASLPTPPPPDPDKPDGGEKNDGGGSTDGGGGGGAKPKPKPAGNPPNITENEAGYNTEMFADLPSVHYAFDSYGYDVGPDNSKPPSKAGVRLFQKHWNVVSSAMRTGLMSPIPYLVGSLDEDGVAGKYTLRALEILNHNAIAGTLKGWQSRVSQAKGAVQS